MSITFIALALLALVFVPRAGAVSCPDPTDAPEMREPEMREPEAAAAPRLLLPGDHRVRPGQVVHLAWSAADSVSELEILLSVVGEHPFTTCVSPRLDPRRHGFDWRVPDFPGAELRLRLRYNGDANLSVIANFPAGVAATITVPATAPQRSSRHD